jgi:transposase
MFVRKLKHPNGRVYVQVVSKSNGRYLVLKSFGAASEEKGVSLVSKAEQWIRLYTGQGQLDFANEEAVLKTMLHSIDEHKLVGLELLLGKIFDDIGFNKIRDAVFRQLVIYRIAFPTSKLKTVQYLYRHCGLEWTEDMLYRYMDKLYNKQKELVQLISYEHTLQVLGEQAHIVFYDVTTLYFEIDREDELRKTGFSKEGKHQNPQIVLGLLVSKNGYPLAYDIFEGNKFEGHTMLPVIDKFSKKYGIGKLVVIADAGLLSRSNIEQLEQRGYEYILGAKIKNEPASVQQKILKLSLENGQSSVVERSNQKLIVTYSEGRAKKDRYNREKGLRRLQKQLKTNRLTKATLNKRGYNKFLRMEGAIKVSIDESRVQQDACWDGLKGYITNTTLSADEAIENYRHLWQIEKAFRITKTDLKVRPVYHHLPRRIEAHICISFVAYKVYKELERQLKEKASSLSPAIAIEIAETIFQIRIELPHTKQKVEKLLLLTEEQKLLAKTFDFGC